MGKSSASLALPLAPSAGVSRLLTPSLSDILFVAIVGWCFLSGGAGWSSLLMDGDAGFHIRVGDWIREHGQAPSIHPFAFSVTGREWFAFEWLSQVAVSWLHSEWGLKGVTLASGLLIAAVFTILFRYTVWLGANPLIAAFLALLAANAARIHFWARPHLVTWLFLLCSIWIVERERRGPTAWTWSLVPITIVWANAHGGFVLFFVLLAIQLGVFAVQARRGVLRWGTVRRLSLIGAVALSASIVNPYGIRLFTHVVEIVSAGWLRTIVDEFKAPSFRGEPLTVFMGLLFGGLILCGRLVRKGRLDHAVWVVFLGYSCLTAVRQVPIFALIVTPILAVELSELWTAFVARTGWNSIARILDDVAAGPFVRSRRTSILPAAFVALLAFGPGFAWPAEFPPDLFPTKLVDAHATELAAARVFTTDQWSDYLIYRNYPKQRSFIDGQHQYYGEAHVKDYLALLEGAPSGAAVMSRFGFDYVLCPARAPLASILQSGSDWKVIDRGGGAILFAPVRRIE